MHFFKKKIISYASSSTFSTSILSYEVNVRGKSHVFIPTSQKALELGRVKNDDLNMTNIHYFKIDLTKTYTFDTSFS